MRCESTAKAILQYLCALDISGNLVYITVLAGKQRRTRPIPSQARAFSVATALEVLFILVAPAINHHV